ncbi:TPA: YopX family protein [Streptococcus suis]
MIPKFRAWDTFDEDMVNDIFFSWQDCGYESLNECLSDERWKFMQSTGKMDSTGKVEVYVGDILYYPDQDEDNYAIIKFDEDKLAFVLDNGYEKFIYGDYGMDKVVGNIYQNKDLADYILGGNQ